MYLASIRDILAVVQACTGIKFSTKGPEKVDKYRKNLPAL